MQEPHVPVAAIPLLPRRLQPLFFPFCVILRKASRPLDPMGLKSAPRVPSNVLTGAIV